MFSFMTNLPTTTSEITADWLTEVLHESGTLPAAATVSAVAIDPAAAGVGFMGEVGKLNLTYEGDSGSSPATMMAKFPTQSPDIKAMMRPTRVYEREHQFYAQLASETPVRTPEIYHITCNTSADESVDEEYLILMEDLGHLTLGDQLASVSVEQARAALAGLAKHHARFWNGAGLEDASYIPVINGPLNKSGQPIYDASLPGFKEVFASALRPEMVPYADAYGKNHPLLLDLFGAMPHTLVHFDYRADNLFFEEDGTVVVIDWQSISQGGGAADVAYFLSQNLSVEDRRAHEDDLLHGYHDALAAGGVTGYSYDQLFQDYRVGVIYGWIIPVFAVGTLDSSSERAMALWTAVIERVQAAIFDHKAYEFLEL